MKKKRSWYEVYDFQKKKPTRHSMVCRKLLVCTYPFDKTSCKRISSFWNTCSKGTYCSVIFSSILFHSLQTRTGYFWPAKNFTSQISLASLTWDFQFIPHIKEQEIYRLHTIGDEVYSTSFDSPFHLRTVCEIELGRLTWSMLIRFSPRVCRELGSSYTLGWIAGLNIERKIGSLRLKGSE